MPSPDERLKELRRQRALVQEQLAFLDREIASASGGARPAEQIAQAVLAVHVKPAESPVEGDEVGDLIKSLEEESRSNPAKAKWGCIWLFVATLAFIAICLFAFYWYVSLHQSPPVR